MSFLFNVNYFSTVAYMGLAGAYQAHVTNTRRRELGAVAGGEGRGSEGAEARRRGKGRGKSTFVSVAIFFRSLSPALLTLAL